jgi:polyhydroxyalkanoate synthesis repressor PhaR
MGASMQVKKYSNRRLYDTDDSRYITLEELAAKIQAGTDVQVIDAKTGDDLTQATLVQVITEVRGLARMLPAPLLLQLIRLGNEALTEFFGHYVAAALELYLQARSGVRAIAPYNPFSMLGLSAPDALSRLLGGGTGWSRQPTAPQQTAPPPAASDDVASLRRDLDALRSELKRKRKSR